MVQSPEHRVEVYYRGRVQGVGFRFTAHSLAKRQRVSGFVHNLPDGRVHLVAEGPADEIDALLRDIAAAMGGKIREVQSAQSPATGEFEGFEIR
jgi:acylphosphatase